MRTALVLAFAVAAPAWATGERVLIAANNPLRETLCLSMECVKGGASDVAVTARPVKGGLELVVTSASGSVKLVHQVALNEAGAVSPTDLLHATTVVVQAIESKRAAPPAPPRTARAPVKKLRLVARR